LKTAPANRPPIPICLADDEPYEADRPKLPTSLAEALEALGDSKLFRDQLGSTFIDYYVRLKQAELDRFDKYCARHKIKPGGEVTQWEQNEYYDFF
jgi:glutamine synthetase